ncbi:MAG: FmdB family zinc ribbon protein [Spirochaetia bacterium]
MPTYEYECTSCGHNFEVFQAMSDDPLSKCPECGKKVKRLISAGMGIIFKGSGFYVTDSKKSSSAASSKEGKTESTGSETGGTGKENGSSKKTGDKPGKAESKKEKTVSEMK